MKRVEELLAGARAVVVCTPNIAGRLIGKKRPADDWPRLSVEGLAMPDFHLVTAIENRPLPGFPLAGGAGGFRNGRILPDPAAAFGSPLEPEAALVLGDAASDAGVSVAEAPRAILKRQIARLAGHGFSARVASELEFYLFRETFAEAEARACIGLTPFHHRAGGDNDVLVAGLAQEILDALDAALARSGIVVDQVQAEGGRGQFEVNVRPAAPLEAADDHLAFKHIAKAVAHKRGVSLTFLAKPFSGEAGSGGHIHISLADDHAANALGSAPGALSPFGRSFVAGLAAFTPELTLLHAPYANSYRRLVPGAFTPLQSTWGWDNRTAMVRLLGSAPRLEFRLPGADVNPYLAYAALIAAGLAGVEAGLDLPPPKEGDGDVLGAPALPADLTEAVRAFEASALAAAAFGPEVHAHLLRHGRHELAESRRAVSSWEVMRGFEDA